MAGSVEVHDSYFGAHRVKGQRGKSAYGKSIVFGLLKRQGKVYTEIAPVIALKRHDKVYTEIAPVIALKRHDKDLYEARSSWKRSVTQMAGEVMITSLQASAIVLFRTFPLMMLIRLPGLL